MQEASVVDLQIQPLKGGGPLKLIEARMTRVGLETVDGAIKDHFLVVVTEEKDNLGYHNFLTQRVQVDPEKNLFVPGTPKLSLVHPDNSEGKLVFNFDGQNELVDHGEDMDDPSKIIPVQVWEYRGEAIEVPTFSEWLSDNLHRRVKVARTSGPWNRMSKQNFMENDNPLRSQDGYPVHAVPLEDVEAVFRALNVPADPNRFRYQVLLSGLPFRAIHDYLTVEVNGIQVDQPKACDRCEVTGIDQEKGEFSRVKPLAGIVKLGAARWVRPDNGKKVHIMGENWLPNGETVIRVGDTLKFTQGREVPLQFE
ncbi:MAG: MOSC domain-containing protein [Candidatus Daviesbacteria bacterium]|nr:MOSC domain-containing protein [Candidatus Daviesbacteria bacterium]